MSRHRSAQLDRPVPRDATLENRPTTYEGPRLVKAQAVRASDAEREAVATALRQNAAEGRLTMQELEERLGSAYAAKTHAELQPLLADLTTSPDARAALAGLPPPDWQRGLRSAKRPRSAFVGLMAVCWAIWGVSVAASGGHSLEGLWPLWLMLVWVLALVRRRSYPLTTVGRNRATK
ncbi:MAG TPA: DUF1707 domain-containing protein [Acidimicrobiales bacterium]|nr:DUF1707 domain-containing protein [Acidimicrobiales bacterium]